MKKYFPGEPIIMNHWNGRNFDIVPFLSDEEFYTTDEADKKIERLKKNLEKYGGHIGTCPQRGVTVTHHGCTCGFREALKEK